MAELRGYRKSAIEVMRQRWWCAFQLALLLGSDCSKICRVSAQPPDPTGTQLCAQANAHVARHNRWRLLVFAPAWYISEQP